MFMRKKSELHQDPLAELARLIGEPEGTVENDYDDAFEGLAHVILETLKEKSLEEDKSKINHCIDWRW